MRGLYNSNVMAAYCKTVRRRPNWVIGSDRKSKKKFGLELCAEFMVTGWATISIHQPLFAF